jgi:hypothetical protein
MIQVVECLPCKCKALSPKSRADETGGLQASLDNTDLSLETEKKNSFLKILPITKSSTYSLATTITSVFPSLCPSVHQLPFFSFLSFWCWD